MDFFIKAHSSKNKNSSRKESKSEETTKKQLKQMLYGYKQSDNALIKNSDNLKNDFDDSTSASGFSDLNLTNSSLEGDETQESSNTNDISLSEFNALSLDKSLQGDIEDNNTASTNSVSDDSLEIHDISEVSEDISLNSSILKSSTDNDSDPPEAFDPDGALASKILKRLAKKENVAHQKVTKRKLNENNCNKKLKGPYRPKQDHIEKHLYEVDDESDSIKVRKRREIKSPQLDSSGQVSNEDFSLESEDMYKLNSKTDSMEYSSPFVSITATNMPSESLGDILGDYKHSTMKNLPTDSQNTMNTTNIDIFSTEDIGFDKVAVEEIVDSLSEIDNDQTVDDIVDSELDTTTNLPNEESTIYDETLQSQEISDREPSTESIDGTLTNPVTVYYGKNCCVFVLRHPSEIFIHGKVQVMALGGTVEVFGYTLQDKPCEIYAPNYNYAQYLRTLEKQNAYYGLFGKLTSSGLSVSEAEDIVVTLGEYDAVVRLQPLKSKKMDFAEDNFTVTDLFSKPNKNIDNYFKAASEQLGCSLYLKKPWKSFEEYASWKQALKSGFNDHSRGIVCGGKGTGKSTFLRYYINKMLARGPVLLVDLDPGQCEFTVAGNVSATVVTEPLLGPNFTHLRKPEMMLNIGMINTMDNPRRYTAAIETLITHCSRDGRLNNMSWIVNTMGMCNAMGLKFISLAILHTQPTFLLQIDSKNAKKRFDCNLYSQTIKQLYYQKYNYDRSFRNIKSPEGLCYSFFVSHHTETSVKSNFSLAPRDERYLNFLAYFGELLNARSGGLLEIVPYEVNLNDLNIGANVKISEDALTKVLNGKVIALCQQTASDNKVFTLADKPLLCHGHGLVRGIDWETGVLYIITPTSAKKLAEVNTLVYADWVPELRGEERRLPAGTPVPYRTAAPYQQRQLTFAPKRRFNPLQLLKMTRSS